MFANQVNFEENKKQLRTVKQNPQSLMQHRQHQGERERCSSYQLSSARSATTWVVRELGAVMIREGSREEETVGVVGAVEFLQLGDAALLLVELGQVVTVSSTVRTASDETFRRSVERSSSTRPKENRNSIFPF